MMDYLQYYAASLHKFTAQSGVWRKQTVTERDLTFERRWRPLDPDVNDKWRLCVHRIPPVGNGFMHPHPWPMAVLILGPGSYEMQLGTGVPAIDADGQLVDYEAQKPPADSVIYAPPGFAYALTSPTKWHAIRVHDAEVFSIMVTGPAYGTRSSPAPTLKGRPMPLSMFHRHETRSQLIHDCLRVFNQPERWYCA